MSSLIQQRIKRVENGLLPYTEGAEGAKKATQNLQRQMQKFGAPGLSVALISEGKLEWTKAYGVQEKGTDVPVTPNTLFNACSITKLLTTIASLILVQEGKLDLDDDVNSKLLSWQVPDSEYTRSEKVTLRLLLSHQAGFVDDNGSFGPYQSGDPIPTCLDILNGTTQYNPNPVQVTYLPGSKFEYSDAGFSVIEQLIVDATGCSFKDVIESRVILPLGMKHSRLQSNPTFSGDLEVTFGHNKYGRVIEQRRAIYPYLSGSSLWSTPHDLSLLITEVLQLLKGAGSLPVSSKLIEELFAQQGCVEWSGLGVFLDNEGKQAKAQSFGWGVGAQSMISMYPSLRSAVILMTNSEPGCHQNKALIGEILRSIEHEYGWD